MMHAILLLALVLAAPQAPSRQADTLRSLVGKSFAAHVVAVPDGDTVDVVRDGERLALRVRLDGVDTPERGEPFNAQATRFTRSLLFDQRVDVRGTDVDRYGRLVARITRVGQDASLALLHAGLACHFTRYSADPVLTRGAADARTFRRGFWAASGNGLPRCARGAQATPASATPPRAGTSTGTLHGNTSSHVYHASWCPNYRCRNCTAVFATARDAQAAGYRPAADCSKR